MNKIKPKKPQWRWPIIISNMKTIGPTITRGVSSTKWSGMDKTVKLKNYMYMSSYYISYYFMQENLDTLPHLRGHKNRGLFTSLKCINFLLGNPFIDLWSSNLCLCCSFYDVFLGWHFLWYHQNNIGNNQINYLSTMNCFWINYLLLDSMHDYSFTCWLINIL